MLPKWHVVDEQLPGLSYKAADCGQQQQQAAAAQRRRSSCDNTLDPKSKRGRVTIQTDDGPRDVRSDNVGLTLLFVD